MLQPSKPIDRTKSKKWQQKVNPKQPTKKGGSPASSGYVWHEKKGGWHRPWDKSSFISPRESPSSWVKPRSARTPRRITSEYFEPDYKPIYGSRRKESQPRVSQRYRRIKKKKGVSKIYYNYFKER